ncbi:MAG TPA: S8 family serine peptidase [Pyrinomonadaceae bacterium]
MNRHNLFGHLALAVAIIILAAFVGQIRRMEWRAHQEEHTAPPVEQTAAPQEEDRADGEDAEEAGDEEQGDAEVLVRFKPGTSPEAVERLAAQLNDRVEDRFEDVAADQVVIADEDGLGAEEVAAEYRNLPEVLYAEPNFEIELDPSEDELGAGPGLKPAYDDAAAEHAHPSDPMFDEQWSLDNHGTRGGKQGADISAVKAWEKTHGSRKIVVAVLDTGVDYTHRDLVNNIWVRPASVPAYHDDELGDFDDGHGFDAADMDGDPMDDHGHGTHCAGIVGAEGDNADGIAGVNWQVEIMPLKFLGANGSGTVKDAIECINYAIDRKKAGVNLRVISASWGSTMYSRALEDAIRRAGEEGILFVAAAGNSSSDNDRRQHYPSGYQLPNVVSVAALTRTDALASFSNWGVKTVHVAAPGAEILSTWPQNQYEEHSGTSMATPEVSGVAALVLAVNPNMSMQDLRARLLASVDKLPALDGKIASGGRINAAKAVKAE